MFSQKTGFDLSKPGFLVKVRNIFQNVVCRNGTIINEQTMILREVQTFYENLYSSRDAELTEVALRHDVSNSGIKN